MSNIRVLVGLAADVATPHRERVRAFAEVVRVFQDMAVGYAYSVLTDIQLAEDAAQEAFVESWVLLAARRAATAVLVPPNRVHEEPACSTPYAAG